ncbi:uncharacterized protein LOC143196606 isoform X1 [Rhynchophorus ferrugineus]|uniref:uncharacterized protein LOC143196606 isoform X1 n=2 Tax=Rhynchophorus ferrugineus TaxID=354439 RepID=UPI003FCDD767
MCEMNHNMYKRRQNDQRAQNRKNPKFTPPSKVSFILDMSPIKAALDQPTASSTSAVTDKIPLYSSDGLRKTMHGNIFQLRLLMLFLDRAHRVYDDFYLATEMNKAEKFDDVVLLFKKKGSGQWFWRFLQAKHTSNMDRNKITESELLKSDEKKPMALVKYLKSLIYIKSCGTFKDSCFDTFVLCVNHNVDNDAKTHLTECNEPDPILDFKQHRCRKYSLNPISKMSSVYRNRHKNCKETFREELLNVYRTVYPKEPDPCPDDVDDFFAKFRLIPQYPNKDNLVKFINKEMGEQMELLNAELATSSFQDKVLEYMAEFGEETGGRYMVVKDARKFKDKLKCNINTLMMAGLSKARPETLRNYKISFRTIPQEWFSFSTSSTLDVLLIITESVLLTAIKVAQFLKSDDENIKTKYGPQDSYIFLTLDMCLIENIKELACSSFDSDTTHNLFVLEGLTDDLSVQDNDLCNRLENTLDYFNSPQSVTKQLIIIAKYETDSPKTDRFQKIQDTVGFKELNDQSQESLLTRKIEYQNEILALHLLLNARAAQQIFDLCTIERLLLGEDIVVEAVRTSPYDGYDKDNYINRTLSHQIVNREMLKEEPPEKSTKVLIIGTDSDIPEFANKRDNIVIVPGYKHMQHELDKHKNSANIIVLVHKNDELLWVDFKGDPTAIYKYLKEFDVELTLDEIKEDEIASIKTNKKKINILVDNPGTGKSCLLVSLAGNLKAKDRLLWVVKVNLNDHAFDPKSPLSKDIKYKSLKDVDFEKGETNKAVKFLMEMVFPEAEKRDKSGFQRDFFIHSLCYEDDKCLYPQVAILFDGFDEISPIYREQTLRLLRALNTSRAACVWVTSRLQEKHILEKELGSVAYHLNPFTKEQQKQYMKKVWKSKQAVLSDFNTILSKVEGIQRRLISAMRSDFTNVPLQLKMLVDVVVEENNRLPEDFGLYDLYRNFTESKFKVYYEEKRAVGATVAGTDVIDRDIQIMTTKHGNIALALFFPELFDDELQNEIENEFSALIRIGLLIPGGQLVRFVHMSFAEYFLAIHIAEKVGKDNIQDKIIRILCDNNFKVTRKFLNKIPNFINWMAMNSKDIINALVENFQDMATFINMLIEDELINFMDILNEPILANIANQNL